MCHCPTSVPTVSSDAVRPCLTDLVAGHSHRLSSPVILLEELDGVAAGNDACTLILQQKSIRTLQYCGVVSMVLQSNAGEETAK